MRKLITLTWKEVYLTFTNRSLLIIMVAAPLMIATIVGMAFGGLGGSGLTFESIPIAIINLDQGVNQQGTLMNYGAMLQDTLIPTEGTTTGDFAACPIGSEDASSSGAPEGVNITLDELFIATVLDDIETGRAAVESGDYVALIIVPEGFSAGLSPEITPFADDEPTTTTIEAIEVYANNGTPVAASIVNSVVRGFTNTIHTGNIAIGATVTALVEANPLAAAQLNTNQEAAAVLGCGFTGQLNTLTIDQSTLTAIEDDDDGFAFSLTTEILASIGAAQAVFFALFTGQFGVLNIIEERGLGTLQRMLVTPTKRRTILGGNLMGTLATVLFQLTLLLAALTLIASLIEGQIALIYGTNILAIGALIVTLAICVSGIGILIVGLVKTPQQVSAFGIVLNMIMGILGGAYGFAAPKPFAYISPIYWGMDGFTRLSVGNSDVWLNVVVLFIAGIVLFVTGTFFFNRRLDI